MVHQYQQKRIARRVRKQSAGMSDDWQNTKSRDPFSHSSQHILHLQRTIGNQAVQRLIVQRDLATDAVPMDANKSSEKEADLPAFVATIVASRQGEFKTKSRIAGHEGKIEILSMNFQEDKSAGKKVMKIRITRYVDDISARIDEAYRTGEPIKSAKFTGIRRTPDGKIEAVRDFEFSDGHIAGYSVSSASGGNAPMEVIELEFPVKEDKEKPEHE